jgi:intergrase/recombinase
MDQIDKLISEEFVEAFSDKIFSRFKNEEGVIDEIKFKQLARCLKLDPANDRELFLSIATRQNTIEDIKFKDFFK